MLWKLFVSLLAFFLGHHPHAPSEDIPYDVTPHGPQSWREAQIAQEAIQGEEGDMRFAEDWPESAGIKDERFRWPGYPGKATVYYRINSSARHLTNLIKKAMEQYHQKTCIRFVEATNQRNYVNIVSKRGCYSYVGLVHSGPQELSLGRGCEYVGTIVHELGHAIGLYHEHQRSDRDQYLNVYTSNVVQGQTHNFDKTPANKEIKDGKYDYQSIMHYGNYAFSKQPGKLKTMEAKNGTPLKEPYEKQGLNDNDIRLIKTLYKC